MKFRLPYSALALAFVVGACESDAPTGANSATPQADAPALAKQTSGLLSNISVDGTLSDATAFTGTLTVTRLGLDRATGDLLVSGVLRDAAGQVVARFTDVVATLVDPDGGACEILDLRIGAIELDLLGLVVNLDPIHLNITAERGPGNLLGNLLCALVGLLDDFPGALQQILNIINSINGLLR